MKNIAHLCLFVFSFLLTSSLSAQQDIPTADNKTYSKPNKYNTTSKKSKGSGWLMSSKRKATSSDKSTKKKADKLYEKLGYMASANQYRMLDAGELVDRKVMARLANSYRLNGKTEEAEYWYAHVAGYTDDNEDVLHYAQVLQSNGNCEDAIRWYKRYVQLEGEKATEHREFIEDCSETKTFKNHEMVALNNMRALNSKALDFSPVPYGDGLVFTSNRGRDRAIVTRDSWTNSNFSDLFYAEFTDEGELVKVKAFEGEVNGKYHDGVATFDRGQSIMMFTRNNQKGKRKDGLINLKLYVANSIDEYWTNVQMLPFSSNDFSTCHPTLSADGERLYFASDKEGGYGGMDLYVSVFTGDGWEEPLNMGPTVNSAGNEIFPFIGEDDVLYFASNGHLGLGGLDIYKATKTQSDDEESWNKRENLGTPFNSPKDDFGYYIDKDKKKGFLSSNRDGGQGGDDVYQWSGSLSDEDDVVSRVLCVYDVNTQEMIEGAEILILEADDSESIHGNTLKQISHLSESQQAAILKKMNIEQSQYNFTTDEKGQFVFKAERGKDYIVKIEKSGFDFTEKNLSGKELLEDENYCVGIGKNNRQLYKGLVINSDYDHPLPEALVTIFNKCTGEEKTITSRRDGTFDFYMVCGCEYTIVAAKSQFDPVTKEVMAMSGDCGKFEPQEGVFNLKLGDGFAQNDSPEAKEMRDHFLEDPEGEFYEGQIIALEGIYYDYGKWAIRNDAEAPLNKVISLLAAYPNMEIEMMSHTDSRGTTAFNGTLSVRRAKSILDYLVGNGIDANRLTSKGYGERELTNGCSDGVSCSESDHQMNRRTEIKIRKM